MTQVRYQRRGSYDEPRVGEKAGGKDGNSQMDSRVHALVVIAAADGALRVCRHVILLVTLSDTQKENLPNGQ